MKIGTPQFSHLKVHDCFNYGGILSRIIGIREFGGKKWVIWEEVHPSHGLCILCNHIELFKGGKKISRSTFNDAVDGFKEDGSLRFWFWDEGSTEFFIAATSLPQARGIQLGLLLEMAPFTEEEWEEKNLTLDEIPRDDPFWETEEWFINGKWTPSIERVSQTTTPGVVWCRAGWE